MLLHGNGNFLSTRDGGIALLPLILEETEVHEREDLEASQNDEGGAGSDRGSEDGEEEGEDDVEDVQKDVRQSQSLGDEFLREVLCRHHVEERSWAAFEAENVEGHSNERDDGDIGRHEATMEDIRAESTCQSVQQFQRS